MNKSDFFAHKYTMLDHTIEFDYYNHYHPYTRRITNRDRGREILCVRAVPPTPKGAKPSTIANMRFVGQRGVVRYVRSDWSISCVRTPGKCAEIPAKYNNSCWVVLGDVPEAVKNTDYSHLKHRICILDNPAQFNAAVCGVFEPLTCAVCLKQYDLKRCSQCKEKYYCSPECQDDDWPKHQLVCKDLADLLTRIARFALDESKK